MGNKDSLLVCSNCEVLSPDVKMRNVYIGGRGDVRLPYCENEVACWQRRDVQLGLPADFSLEKN